MAFDKETYWKNRKAGKRGQGSYPNLAIAYHTPKDWLKRGKASSSPTK